MPLLLRSPLLNLPVVLATDFPPVQIVAIAMILTTMLVLQLLAWPWKASNKVDPLGFQDFSTFQMSVTWRLFCVKVDNFAERCHY